MAERSLYFENTEDSLAVETLMGNGPSEPKRRRPDAYHVVVQGVTTWWGLTTSHEYLSSSASRRDLWYLLLPAPVLFTILADYRSWDYLCLVDVSLAMLLLWAAWGTCLSIVRIWSDTFVAFILFMYVVAHSLSDTEVGAQFSACQLFAVVAMFSAGVHSSAIFIFSIGTVATATYVEASWKSELFFVCLYVACSSALAELRVASYIEARSTYNVVRAFTRDSRFTCDSRSAPDSRRYDRLYLDPEDHVQNATLREHFAKLEEGNVVPLKAEQHHLEPWGKLQEVSKPGAEVLDAMEAAEQRHKKALEAAEQRHAKELERRQDLLDAAEQRHSTEQKQAMANLGREQSKSAEILEDVARLQKMLQLAEERLQQEKSETKTKQESGVHEAADRNTALSQRLMEALARERRLSNELSSVKDALRYAQDQMISVRQETLSARGRQGVVYTVSSDNKRPPQRARATSMPPDDVKSEDHARSLSRPRFQAFNKPGAAEHEAPQFAGAGRAQRGGNLELGGSVERGRDSSPSVPPPLPNPTATMSEIPSARLHRPAMSGIRAEIPPDTLSVVSVASAATTSPPPSVCTVSTSVALRGVKLSGFQTPELNGHFVERQQPGFEVNGRETYWTTAGDFFMFRSAATGTWAVAKAKRFRNVKKGQHYGLAHSPTGYNIMDQAPVVGWQEFDKVLGQWVLRPQAGVRSRGKVRPRSSSPCSSFATLRTDEPRNSFR